MTETVLPSKQIISVGEMWSIAKGDQKIWGIEGYEVPKEYTDYRQIQWLKKRELILKEHKRIWPPADWPKENKDSEKQIPPKRANYLDQIYKWSNSFYDPEKAKNVIERLAQYDRRIGETVMDKKIEDKRANFLKAESEKEKLRKERPEVPDFKQEAIDKVKDKLKAWEEEKKKEENKKIPKGTWAKCDRITIVADAEHMGEKYPFYNTYKKEGENTVSEVEDEKKNKKKNDLFFPDVFN